MGKKTKGNKKEKELTKAQRIEAKKAKQAAKSLRKDKKQQEEEDIEVILQEFLKKDAERTQIIIEDNVPQPSPRANFSMTMLTNGDMVMFGGEYFDGEVNTCFNELYRWNVDTNTWKSIASPNTPPPRCSHQAVLYRDHVYIFGGEFATADQFHHYRDFWRLDLKTNAWEALDEKNGPSARSGHRMVVWRNFLIVYGGFYEAARETKWFNDLFIFSFADMKWRKITYPILKQVPTPRSGCQLAVHPSKDFIFMYGGYAKVKKVGEKSEGKIYSDLWALHMTPLLKRQDPTWEKLSRKGQAPGPRGGAAVTVHKNRFILFGGVYDEEGRRHSIQSTFYNDLFVYDMDRKRWFEFQLRGKKDPNAKRRRKKNKNSIVSVNDEEYKEQDNELEEEEEEEEEDDFEKMLEQQFGYVDEQGNIVYIEDAEEQEEEEEEETKEQEKEEEEEDKSEKKKKKKNRKDKIIFLDEEEEEEEKKEEEELAVLPPTPAPAPAPAPASKKSIEIEIAKPCPRINPALIIRGSTMYVYGGVVEDGDREITLDDCWSLDLKRLEEWVPVLNGTMDQQQWKGEVSDTEEGSSSEEDDEDDEDDEEDEEEDEEKEEEEAAAATVERAVEMLDKQTLGAQDEEEDDEEEEEEEKDKKKKKKKKKKTTKKPKNDRRVIRAEIEKLQDQLQLDDINRTPQVNENLRDFFARTIEYWSTQIAQRPDTRERQLSIKEIKREGFLMAEQRYHELLPILERLNVLEMEQIEAEEEYLLKKSSKRGGGSSHSHSHRR